ncbi:MAG TPA: phage holin family protein [Mycobacterium sp.]|nr:phage holin family protein [Mycobacterium sp.]
MSGPPDTKADAPLGELLSQLSTQTSRLVRDEIRLAQREVERSARHAAIGAGLGGVAGVLALLGAASAVAAVIAALALVLPVWAASAIVAASLFAAAGVAMLTGKKQAEQISPPAAQVVDNVKRDVQEIKDARHGG